MGNVKLLDESPSENSSDPRHLLSSVMKEKGVSFDVLKNKLIKEKFESAEHLKSIEDIPKFKIFELIKRLKKV